MVFLRQFEDFSPRYAANEADYFHAAESSPVDKAYFCKIAVGQWHLGRQTSIITLCYAHVAHVGPKAAWKGRPWPKS